MGYVKSSNNNSYFYVIKHNQSNILESSYDGKILKMEENIVDKLRPLLSRICKKSL